MTLDNKILSLKHLVKHYVKFCEVENFELRKYCIPISTSRNQVILAEKSKNISIEFTFARIISLINLGRLSTVRYSTIDSIIDIQITLESRDGVLKIRRFSFKIARPCVLSNFFSLSLSLDTRSSISARIHIRAHVEKYCVSSVRSVRGNKS